MPIQPRTSPLKFDGLAAKSEKDTVSYLSIKVAMECEPVTEMRGSAPTAECLAQWGTTPEPQEKDMLPQDTSDLLYDESFAAALGLAAITLAL